jgi:uncharacterized membrane protein
MHNSRNKILQWIEIGQFEGQEIDRVIQIAQAEPQPTEWINFLKIGLLWSAVISLCCGVIFFFAYNWQDMGRFTKFALVEMVMLISTLAYIRIASTKLLTSTTLMGMTLFTGALLALVGQTYQTGADPWQLFAIWGLLMLPWAFVARASSLWIVWVALVNLSVALYLEISHGIFGILFTEELSIWIFAGLNSLLLCAFEYHFFMQTKTSIGDKNGSENNNRYVNQLLAIIAGTAATFLALWSIFEYKVNLTGFIFYLIWIAIAFYLYRYKIRDLFILSAGSLSVIVVVVSLLIKAIDSSMDDGGFLLVSFAIISLSTLAGIWLKNLSKEFNSGSPLIEPTLSSAVKTEDRS